MYSRNAWKEICMRMLFSLPEISCFPNKGRNQLEWSSQQNMQQKDRYVKCLAITIQYIPIHELRTRCCPEVFCKKVLLKNFVKFTEKISLHLQ